MNDPDDRYDMDLPLNWDEAYHAWREDQAARPAPEPTVTLEEFERDIARKRYYDWPWLRPGERFDLFTGTIVWSSRWLNPDRKET